ncbi:helix-turn-helix domain-containing protein [Nitrospirillum viridazoti]|uniref:Transcriptional regulator n=1 Tax=Nitrospirillum viridazoti CBAmc TaxID=1441467 RepID=A0A248K1Z8_9PROT|nr:helix-turn-helix transcriptional regulator [Nitrospirillum amazonense]ASG24809.1 transcriptional regulator [Nitrospirillum amazonense CBAmc]TWB25982.1 helix-turn-helix protein [Nitrospirillum amazonense]
MAREQFRDDYRKLLQTLVARRKAAGVTQEEVARQLGIRQNVVSKYELGEVRLNVVEYVRYCRAIGLDPGELLAGVGHF